QISPSIESVRRMVPSTTRRSAMRPACGPRVSGNRQFVGWGVNKTTTGASLTVRFALAILGGAAATRVPLGDDVHVDVQLGGKPNHLGDDRAAHDLLPTAAPAGAQHDL